MQDNWKEDKFLRDRMNSSQSANITPRQRMPSARSRIDEIEHSSLMIGSESDKSTQRDAKRRQQEEYANQI